MNRLAKIIVHVSMLAFVCAIVAFWALKILTPQPTAAPPPIAMPPPREPDPVLTARMFGLVQSAPAAQAANVQALGLFAAGKDSAAVLTVDGKPPRAFVIGQEVAPGTRLVEVRSDSAVLEGAGGKLEVRAPTRPPVSTSATPARPAFTLQGNTLSAPATGTPPAPMPLVRPNIPSVGSPPPPPTVIPEPPPNQAPAPPPGQPPNLPQPPNSGTVAQ